MTVFDGSDIDVIGEFGVVVHNILIEFNPFSPDHNQVSLIFEHKID